MKGQIGFQRQSRMGDTTMDIVLVGAVGLGLYLAYKAISGMIGPTKDQITQQNNKTVTTDTASANAATQAHIQATGQTPTLQPATIVSLSNSVVSEVTSMDPSDFPLPLSTNLPSIIDQVNNYADWIALVAQFGTKKLLNDQAVDLTTALSMALPPQYKSSINSYFVEQAIADPNKNYIFIP